MYYSSLKLNFVSYIKLLFLYKKYRYKFTKSFLVKDIIKYILLSLVLFNTLTYHFLKPQSSFQSKFNIEEFISSGKLALLIIFVAAILAHFSLVITKLYPVQPFLRLEHKNTWFIKSYIFPLFSSVFGVLFISLISTLGLKGLIYFLLFYLINLLSNKLTIFRYLILIIIILMFIGKMEEQEILIITGFLFVCCLVIDRIKLNSLVYEKLNSKMPFKGTSVFWAKEISYYTYYKSEQVYTIISSLIYFYMIFFNLTAIENGEYPFSPFIFIPLTFLIFSQTTFNMLGMDTNVINTFFYMPELTIQYLIKKVRIYQYVISFFNLIFLVILVLIMKAPQTGLAYFLGFIAFNEFMLFAAVLVSLYFIKKKEVKWRYGQYAFSKNVNLTSLIMVLFTVMIIYSYKLFDLWGLLFLIVIASFMANRLVKTGTRIIEYKKKRSYKYV